MSKIDTADFHSLYSEHQGWLCGWLHKRIGCGHRAADLTQDTFERVLSRTDTSTVREPRPWLLTIAKRILIDKSRRARLEQAYLEQCTALVLDNPTMAPSTEAITEAVQALEKIAEALDGLPVNVRNTFVLRNIDGLTLEDIAIRLGVSRTMVRKYLVQSLAACSRVLQGETS